MTVKEWIEYRKKDGQSNLLAAPYPKSNYRLISVRLCNEATEMIRDMIPERKKGYVGGFADWIRNLIYKELNISPEISKRALIDNGD